MECHEFNGLKSQIVKFGRCNPLTYNLNPPIIKMVPLAPDTIFIDERFCGPPESGNGGYVCGLLSSFLEGLSEITLRQPPPLNRPLQVDLTGDYLTLRDGNAIIAEGKTGKLDIEPPEPPSFSLAVDSSKHYIGFEQHQFPTCFVCGPDRVEGEGLRIFAGPVPGQEIVSAPWTPGLELADSHGHIKPEFLWAAMDCPGYYAISGQHHPVMLLGRMTARIVSKVLPGTKVIVIGSMISQEGRKAEAITALYSEEGNLIANALSVWIELRPKSI